MVDLEEDQAMRGTQQIDWSDTAEADCPIIVVEKAGMNLLKSV